MTRRRSSPQRGKELSSEPAAEPPVRAELEARLDRAVRELIDVNVQTPKMVASIRNQYRRLFERRASRNLPPVASIADAIDEARAWCSDWTREDFEGFCQWIRCSCPEWASSISGLEAQIFDAVADHLPIDTLSGLAFYVWQTGSPHEYMRPERWREIFSRGGYVEDFTVTQRPGTGTVVLYRGSPPSTRANWSWTSTYAVAELYRRKMPGSVLWVARVPWENVLARLTVWSPGYDEFVVDTMLRDGQGCTIPIRRLDAPQRTRHWTHCRLRASKVPGRCMECGAMIPKPKMPTGLAGSIGGPAGGLEQYGCLSGPFGR